MEYISRRLKLCKWDNGDCEQGYPVCSKDKCKDFVEENLTQKG